ncbi:uncharacterized protein LOC126366990 [Pectinophora gossypiella]|uniref:uncharacterized protein LOC126366990 n=1 Tax=Pectinophora gossypiella TaxID=13191 RepID=UPI00214F5F57|nr:uncharacterized protein LOC126366990 [Pectinophora gossypiella]
MGHMETVKDSVNTDISPYYIPHHFVLRQKAVTTQLRVVFDASCKTTSGRSLNDNLLTGQKLQQDISEEYRLCTVTFGVASAPFLALRTIRQLAIDEANAFPLASQVLLNDVFVDDVVTGSDNLDDALALQRQLTSICKAGTFELRKWTSNSSDFLSHVFNNDETYDDSLILSALDTDKSVKVLGLKWNSKSDSFTYQTDTPSRKCTKRIMLAEIAKIYDPLGFLSPITLFAKHLIQLLWVSGVGWDDAPPQGICDLWYQFLDELPLLQNIALPRHVLPSTHNVQLHGFSDASEKAYSACVYIRVIDADGCITSHLLLGKTKVAPLKRLSIPRLELCGALLLSKLIKKVITAYSSYLTFDEIFAWCDSSITLAWLRSSPDKWRTYVCNRIAETTSNVPAAQWHHVRSADNPADPASRGVLPSRLDHQQWFHGPSWLSKPQPEWPISHVNCHTDEERRKHTLVTQKSEPTLEFIERFSSLPKMLRIMTLQCILAQTYWILCARDAVRMRTRRCVRCFRARPVARQPPMAPLPAARGSVVVLIDNTLPPLQWRLARVQQLHPGSDGVTRVVTVRTGNTHFNHQYSNNPTYVYI